MTIQEQLTCILELAQAKVKCPCACHLKVVFHKDSGCPECQSTGYVPDPRYKGLGEALTEPCLGSKAFYVEAARRGIAKAFIDICQGAKCPWCRGSGRVLRTWQQGALAGVLKHWAVCRWEEVHGKDRRQEVFYAHLSCELGMCFGHSDCNEQAAQVVLEAMEKEKAHATNPGPA